MMPRERIQRLAEANGRKRQENQVSAPVAEAGGETCPSNG
jgi:hypothetical protein